MKTDDLISQHLIASVIQQHTDNVAVDPIASWEQMATKIISIIGEGGFDSLYARSLFLAKASFPWLESGIYTPQTPAPFLALKASYAGQAPEQVSAANFLLLVTFTGVLTSLIGEQLTLSILRSAWSLHTPVSYQQGIQK
jgi:hypothetical protein